MACTLKGEIGSSRGLGEVKHGPFVGKQALKVQETFFAFVELSNFIRQAAHAV